MSDRQVLVGRRTRHARTFYEVVTSNGHGVHRRVEGPLAEAQRVAARVAEAWSLPDDVFELQQVVEFDGYSRRYFMRAGSQWVPWASDQEIEDRKPDWQWLSSTAAPGQERSHV